MSGAFIVHHRTVFGIDDNGSVGRVMTSSANPSFMHELRRKYAFNPQRWHSHSPPLQPCLVHVMCVNFKNMRKLISGFWQADKRARLWGIELFNKHKNVTTINFVRLRSQWKSCIIMSTRTLRCFSLVFTAHFICCINVYVFARHAAVAASPWMIQLMKFISPERRRIYSSFRSLCDF